MSIVLGLLATELLYWLARTVDVVVVTGVQSLAFAITALPDLIVRNRQLEALTIIRMGIVILA